MKIKRCPLIFHNMLSMSIECNEDELNDELIKFKYAILQNDLVPRGPIIYRLEKLENRLENKYIFLIAVDRVIKLNENDIFHFIEEFKIEDGLSIRHADLDESLNASYDFLDMVAKSLHICLQKPFYNIYLDVYGGGLIDIYAPIVDKEVVND